MSGAVFLFDLHPNIVVSLQSNTLQKITPYSNYFYGVCIENDPFGAFYSRFLCWHARWRHNRWRHVVMNFNDVIIIGGQYLIELNSGKGNDICQWILLMHFGDSSVTFYFSTWPLFRSCDQKLTKIDHVIFQGVSFPILFSFETVSVWYAYFQYCF